MATEEESIGQGIGEVLTYAIGVEIILLSSRRASSEPVDAAPANMVNCGRNGREAACAAVLSTFRGPRQTDTAATIAARPSWRRRATTRD